MDVFSDLLEYSTEYMVDELTSGEWASWAKAFRPRSHHVLSSVTGSPRRNACGYSSWANAVCSLDEAPKESYE